MSTAPYFLTIAREAVLVHDRLRLRADVQGADRATFPATAYLRCPCAANTGAPARVVVSADTIDGMTTLCVDGAPSGREHTMAAYIREDFAA